MRVVEQSDGFSARVIAGTHVILIALDCDESKLDGFRGFAFKRAKAGGNASWLSGLKVFPSVVPKPPRGASYPTNKHPIQSFLWSDYTAEPDTDYTFEISAMYGAPDKLKAKATLSVAIRTEKELDQGHGVWFNRGAVASQAFAKQFKNAAMTKKKAVNVKDKQVKWLSRGLVEACLGYIDDTKKGEALRVCAYEFTYTPVLDALKRALDREVDVKIVYHGTDANEGAVGDADLPKTVDNEKVLFTRDVPDIPHNKFIVRLDKQGDPVSVWTGSTNFTDSGFLGQTNVGHLVDDPDVAGTYLKFWDGLKKDPEEADAVANVLALTPDPPNELPKKSTTLVFSQRKNSKMLKWYSQRITNAATSAMFTGAFGVDDTILAGLAKQSDSLRFILLEKAPSKEIKDAAKANKGRIVVSFGAVLGSKTGTGAGGESKKKFVPIPQFKLDEWFLDEELARQSGEGFVFFVHTKFLLVDPLSDDPLVCTGSANFSRNSLTANDENMLLIRGDTRVADIYLTEFDRIFRHFYFRDIANAQLAKKPTKSDADAIFLDEGKTWITPYFKQGSNKCERREMFFADTKKTWVAKAKADPSPF